MAEIGDPENQEKKRRKQAGGVVGRGKKGGLDPSDHRKEKTGER